MHDPDEQPADSAQEPRENWDEWFGRHYGRGGGNRRLLLYAVALVVAMTALYISGNSAWFHR